MKKLIQTILFFFALNLLISCGYNWGRGSLELPKSYQYVFVEIFKNNTRETGAEYSFTQALKRELELSGVASLTTKDRAELIITGDIINVTSLDSGSQPTFFKIDYETKQALPYRAPLFTLYKMQVKVNVKAIQAKDKTVLWQSFVHGEKTYRGSQLTKQGIRSSNVLYNESRRKKAMEAIAKEMMKDAFDLMIQDF